MMDVKEVAKEIRRELKKRFPGYQFSVRIDRGVDSAIYIRWTDGPTEEAVKEVVWRYRKVDYDPYSGEILTGGNRYIFLNRKYTEKAFNEALKRFKREWRVNHKHGEVPDPEHCGECNWMFLKELSETTLPPAPVKAGVY